METTLRINKNTKKDLDKFRQYKNESYDEILRKLVFIAKNSEKDPLQSQKIVKNITEARKIIKGNSHYTKSEAKKILGMEDNNK